MHLAQRVRHCARAPDANVVDSGAAKPNEWTLSARPTVSGLFGQKTITGASGTAQVTGISTAGGSSTHAVLTGHTGLSTATVFDNLTQLRKGDAFYVSSLRQTLKYEVTDITVVKPVVAAPSSSGSGRRRRGDSGRRGQPGCWHPRRQ